MKRSTIDIGHGPQIHFNLRLSSVLSYSFINVHTYNKYLCESCVQCGPRRVHL